jgi:putative phosphoesterase
MVIALFSDIHANLPATQAFFKSLDERSPDMIFCLGDLVGYNIWPNEVIESIRSRKISCIAGNHDLKVHTAISADIDLENSGKDYAYHIINNDNREYLKSLPAHLRLEFHKMQMLLVHGSPKSVNEYLLQEMTGEEIVKHFIDTNTDILCFGHSHKPYHRIVPVDINGTTHYKHAINTGSIGKPKDGDPKGCYVLLDVDNSSTSLKPETIEVEFVRFEYDVEKASRAVINSPLPNEFAHMLVMAY